MEKKLTFLVLTVLLVVPALLNLLLLIILFIFRNFLLRLYLNWKCGQSVIFLNSQDTKYSLENPQNLSQSNLCLLMKGTANVLAFKQLLSEKVLQVKDDDGEWKYIKLRQEIKSTFGYYYFLPERNFSVDNHVFFNENVDLKNENELHSYLAEIFDKPFPDGFSPWRMILFNLSDDYLELEPGPHHLLCMSGHHGLCDGISVMSILDNIYDKKNDSDSEDKSRVNLYHSSRTTDFNRVKEFIKILMFGPGNYFYNWFLQADRHILHGKELVGKKFLAFSKPVSLDRVKEIKTRYQLTVNDVLMSCVAAGFRSHFLKKGETPISLRHGVAISMHDVTKDLNLENKFTMGIYSDACDQSSPEKRLEITRKSMNEMKDSEQITIFHWFTTVNANYLPGKITLMIGNMLRVTSIQSNVAGPTTQQIIFGQEIERMSFFVTSVHRVGFGISVMSYNNQVQFGLKADAAYIGNQNDADSILNNMVMELDNLENVKEASCVENIN